MCTCFVEIKVRWTNSKNSQEIMKEILDLLKVL